MKIIQDKLLPPHVYVKLSCNEGVGALAGDAGWEGSRNVIQPPDPGLRHLWGRVASVLSPPLGIVMSALPHKKIS